MEDLLVVIFQFVFEVLLQILAELPWDQFVGANQNKPRNEHGPELWIILSLVAGACVGGVSLIIFPTTLIQWSSVRIANLIAAPMISAFVSLLFSWSARSHGLNRGDRKLRAICAGCFTLILALIRFTYAARPHT